MYKDKLSEIGGKAADLCNARQMLKGCSAA